MNELNNCWFHATLNFLTGVPLLRSVCLSPPMDASHFEKMLLNALLSIFYVKRSAPIAEFFPLVMDFSGINNRYGQVAVPDFIEYLFAKSSVIQTRLDVNITLDFSVCRANGFLRYLPWMCLSNSISQREVQIYLCRS